MDFTQLYNLYYDRIFHVSLAIIRDQQLAEDNVQEAFIKAYKRMETLKEKEKLGAWLCVIATRTAIDFVRRDKKTKGYPMELSKLDCLGIVAKQNVEIEVDVCLFKELLNEKMKDFSREDKKLLFLKLDQGFKEREIASVMEMNPSTVKTKIHRARRKLRERMDVELTA